MSKQELIAKIAEMIDEDTYIRFMDRRPDQIAKSIYKIFEEAGVINNDGEKK